MVKKYHQTRKDRKDESRGMKRYESSRSEGGMDTQFFGMIHEDHSKMANLPSEVMMKEYPKCRYLDSHEIDDTIRGIDDTRDYNIRKTEAHMSEEKY